MPRIRSASLAGLMFAVSQMGGSPAHATPPGADAPVAGAGCLDPKLEGMSLEALAEYQRQFLSVEDALTVSDGASSQGVAFTQGKYRRPLTVDEFLRAVGRSEDAERYGNRRRWAGALAVGSLASILVGVIAVVAGAPSLDGGCGSVHDPGFSQCVQDTVQNPPGDQTGTTFAISSTVGALLFVGALVVHPSPIDAVEMRRLADEHNQALRRRLTETAPPVSRRPGVRLGISADPGREGMSVFVEGRF